MIDIHSWLQNLIYFMQQIYIIIKYYGKKKVKLCIKYTEITGYF